MKQTRTSENFESLVELVVQDWKASEDIAESTVRQDFFDLLCTYYKQYSNDDTLQFPEKLYSTKFLPAVYSFWKQIQKKSYVDTKLTEERLTRIIQKMIELSIQRHNLPANIPLAVSLGWDKNNPDFPMTPSSKTRIALDTTAAVTLGVLIAFFIYVV